MIGTTEQRDRVYVHAMAAGIGYGREAMRRGVQKDAATLGAVSLACYLMIWAGLSAREVADRIGVHEDVVISLADAACDVRNEFYAVGCWIDSIAARMPLINDECGGSECGPCMPREVSS